jgi:hypothetical protein
MKVIIFACYFILALRTDGYTQLSAEYPALISQANALYKSKDFAKSAEAFSKAFQSSGWKGNVNDRYNAACSWALAGMSDSAFFQLFRIAEKGNYTNYTHASNDKDLESLYSDTRWTLFLALVSRNKEKSEEGLNKELILLLDSMETLDQKWRHTVTSLRNVETKNEAESMVDALKSLVLTDSLNYPVLQQIFNRYGFLNYDIVGINGSRKFWLLVQHQDKHPEFQEAVLDKMKIQTDLGKASKMDYAYLLDRVKVNTSQLQVYGTQMRLNDAKTSYEPQPVIDPANLDTRRTSVGLEPIQSYTSSMNSMYSGRLKKD